MKSEKTFRDLSDEASRYISQASAVAVSMQSNQSFDDLRADIVGSLLWTISDRLEDLRRVNSDMWELCKGMADESVSDKLVRQSSAEGNHDYK